MTAGDGASDRAKSMGIKSMRVDGNDVMAVQQAALDLLLAIRSGEGPRLLHAITYRVKGHVSVDLAAYRDPDELAAALLTDPLLRARSMGQGLMGCEGLVFDAIDVEA